MARARDIANLLNSGTFLTPASASATYLEKDNSQPSFRNLIINGAMQVAQRGTSATSLSSVYAYYTADRWLLNNANTGTFTMSVENDAPTGSGFRKSIKLLCTTADASIGSADELTLDQKIEGQNCQAIKKGTANAEQLTLSFWVKSNVTGTYIVNLADFDNSRTISQSYSITSSGTWEKKTIVFPADTTGVLDNDNAASLQVRFYQAAGSNRTSGTLQTTWGSEVVANLAPGQTNLAAATNNYWQITGVQLEVGAVATPFEFKPFAQELQECQRYYETGRYGNNTYPAAYNPNASAGTAGFVGINIPFKVVKRITPHTIPTLSPSGFWAAPGQTAVSGLGNHTLTAFDSTIDGFKFISNRISGNATPTASSVYFWEGASIVWSASSEL